MYFPDGSCKVEEVKHVYLIKGTAIVVVTNVHILIISLLKIHSLLVLSFLCVHAGG